MIPLNDLEIVGYSEALTEQSLPSLVPPVFRQINDGNIYYLSPYTIKEEMLCNAVESDPAEFEKLIRKDQATPLADGPIPARTGFQLWVDVNFNVHYERAAKVKDTFGTLSREYYDQAVQCLVNADLEGAEAFANNAVSASADFLPPWAIKAAIRLHRGDPDAAATMADMASHICPEPMFYEYAQRFETIIQESVGNQEILLYSECSFGMCGMGALSDESAASFFDQPAEAVA